MGIVHRVDIVIWILKEDEFTFGHGKKISPVE